MGARRGPAGPKAGDKAGVGSGGEEAHRQGEEGLRMDLSLRLRAPRERAGLLADPAHGQRGGAVLAGPGRVRQGGGRTGEDKRILSVVGKAGWHTGGQVEVPEGIHLEFLPSGSPELQPAERLWPLTNEALANRLFEEIEELEEALVERCVELHGQAETVRSLTNYHWWPQAA